MTNPRCFVALYETKNDGTCTSGILTKKTRDSLLADLSPKTRYHTWHDTTTPRWDEVTIIISDDYEEGDMLRYELIQNEIIM